MKISLILLAAGDSRRFGSNKLLYELHGKPMYRYSVDEVAKLDTTVFAEKIVVSQYDEILDTLSREGYLTVILEYRTRYSLVLRRLKKRRGASLWQISRT